METLEKKKILVLGGGVEGQHVLQYLLHLGVRDITLADVKTVDTVPPGVKTIFGDTYLDSLKEFEMIFRSPGIPYLNSNIQAAEASGVIITSATKYFFEHCQGKIIGITGSNGKTTTSTLISH